MYLFVIEIFNEPIVLIMSSSFSYSFKNARSNWGDDINWWFLKEISAQPIVSYDWSWRSKFFKKENYQVIGSTLTLMGTSHTVVWGAGCLDDSTPLALTPKRVAAVRGPLTRKRLLAEGIDCPEVYGDPALLLPLYYQPKVEKKYKLGIIPHYVDKKNEWVEDMRMREDVLVIKIAHYEHWLDFIDQINMCENVASSSLHGLIVSQAYGVPNCWIKFSEELNEFKYHDFFLSQGFDRMVIKMTNETSCTDLLKACKSCPMSQFDIQPLIDAAPFELKKNYKISR